MSEDRDADELRMHRILVAHGVGPDAQPDAVTTVAAAANAAAPDTEAQPHSPSASDSAAASATPDPDDWWDDLYSDDEQPGGGDDEAAQPQSQPARRPPRQRIPDWRTGRHIDLNPDDEDDPADDPTEDDEEDLADDTEEDDAEAEDEEADDADPDTGSRAARPGKRRPRLSRNPRSRPAAGAPRALVDAPAAPRRSLLDAYDSIPTRIRWLAVHASAAAAGYRLGWVDYATRTAAWTAANGWLNPSAIFWCLVAVGCEALRYRMRTRRLAVRWLAAVPIASIVTGTFLYGTGWQNLELPL